MEIFEIVPSYSVTEAGAIASEVASRSTMQDYTQRRAANTLRAHLADLETFNQYLGATGASNCPTAQSLQVDPDAWLGVTWGLISGFMQWMLKQGLSLSTINRKLSTVKIYAGLATKAGAIPTGENMMIKSVQGFAAKEFSRVDEKRTVTRTGSKKQYSVALTVEQAAMLKEQPLDTPQGRRDAVVMCLLLDQGLRVGELAALTVANINMRRDEMAFNRPKVQKMQKHRFTWDTKQALFDYMAKDAPAAGQLLRGSSKTGQLTSDGMHERSLHERVRKLGEAIGVKGLSPHDCRHYWATRAIQQGTDPFSLRQAGGWNSMQTVQKYVAENEIANAGVKL